MYSLMLIPHWKELKSRAGRKSGLALQCQTTVHTISSWATLPSLSNEDSLQEKAYPASADSLVSFVVEESAHIRT